MFDIALFKHFIDTRGMVTIYVNMYRKNHLKENPISIEEFLKKVEPEFVCTRAFYYAANSNYGYDYWTRMQVQWMEFYANNRNNHTKDDWWQLTGMSRILRTNWDAAKHWKEETKLTAAIRLGIDLSLIKCDDKTPTAPETKMSEEYLRETHLQEMKAAAAAEKTASKDDGIERLDIRTYIKGKEKEKHDLFGEFEFLDLHARAVSRRRLAADEMSINTKGNKARLTFNQKITKEIKERGGYEYAALLKNKKGDVALILNDEKGVSLYDGAQRESSNASITSKPMIEKITAFLNITREYEIIKATEVEKTKDYVAYILTKLKD